MRQLLLTLSRHTRARAAQARALVLAVSWEHLVAQVGLALRTLVRSFQGEHLHLRAATLTFVTIFSLVPMLTVGLALVGIYHQEHLQRWLQQVFLTLLAPGVREESSAFLARVLQPGRYQALGGVGFVGLLVSAGSLLRNIDASLNEIWGVRRRRPLLVSLLTYTGLLILGPLLLAFSFAGTGAVRSLLVQAQLPLSSQISALLVPGAMVGALAVLYAVAPNTRVSARAALAGGLMGGVGWGLARELYTVFAAYTFRSNPLYGSLGALPLFLAWLYVGWLLILSGARFSYAVEHAAFRDSLGAFGAHPRARELVGARVAQEATIAWLLGTEPPRPQELALRLRVPEPLVLDVVEMLVEAGLLESASPGGLRPTRPPAELTLADLAMAVHGVYNPGQQASWSVPPAPGFEPFALLFHEADSGVVDVLRRTRWLDLALLARPELEAAAALTPAAAPQLASGNKNP